MSSMCMRQRSNALPKVKRISLTGLKSKPGTSVLKVSFGADMKLLPGNSHDRHTFKTSVAQVERLTGTLPKEGHVDCGDKGYEIAFLCGTGHNLRMILRQLELLCD